jgi:glycosyltransferase involved in cell wall biosynthesis
MINQMNKVFSIIIPCHNEEIHLEKCLLSVVNIDYPREKFEVIVVDNESTDLSLSIAKKYADQVICLPNAKVGAVRNAGAKLASGDFFVFIDADCILDPQWLDRAETLIKSYQNTVFGGGILLPENANWIERHWLLEGPEGNSLPSELIGCSIVIHSDWFRSVDGFDAQKSSGEDTDLSTRICKEGTKKIITRDLNVTHLGNAKTISAHIRRQAWHAKSYKISKEKNLKDPVFLLVIIHIFLILLTVAFLTFKLNLLAFLALAVGLISPLILTAKRFYRAKRKPSNLIEIVLAYILDLTYLTGRAIGYLSPPYR